MVKRFFARLLTSFLGAWIALTLFVAVAVIIVISLLANIGMSGNATSVTKGSVLVIPLNCEIQETETARQPSLNDLLDAAGAEREAPQSLDVLVAALKEAATNKNVKMVYLDGGTPSVGAATANALREALMQFKKDSDGKKIIAYADTYTQGGLYIASVADEVYVNPYGVVALTGLGGSTPFFKGLADKLGITFQVAKVGTFKSAVEPYIMDHMSEPARAQLDTLYGAMWTIIRDGLATSRKVKGAEIDSLVNSVMAFKQADVSSKAHLVTKTLYEREVKDMIAKEVGKDKAEDINFITCTDLISQTPWNDNYSSDRQVAVLYATGEIAEYGQGIDCYKLVPVILELADNDDIKGLVLRVNSPGGSVFGSQQIAEALAYFKSKGKPFAVSMGDYAASGGYWISADADRIFANPLTITGSIGIFGLIPNGQGLAQKLGVNFESVSTNPKAMINVPYAPLTPYQMEVLQENINYGYDQFVNRVAKGRNMSAAKVRQIAEGRVWNALKAKEIGLVDEIGNLSDAIDWVVAKAELGDNYRTAPYPKFEPGFWDMIPKSGFAAEFRQFSDAVLPATGVSQENLLDMYRILRRQHVLALAPEYNLLF